MHIHACSTHMHVMLYVCTNTVYTLLDYKTMLEEQQQQQQQLLEQQQQQLLEQHQRVEKCCVM